MRYYRDLHKGYKVIKSCKTRKQLEVAANLLDLLWSTYYCNPKDKRIYEDLSYLDNFMRHCELKIKS